MSLVGGLLPSKHIQKVVAQVFIAINIFVRIWRTNHIVQQERIKDGIITVFQDKDIVIIGPSIIYAIEDITVLTLHTTPGVKRPLSLVVEDTSAL